MSQAKQPIPPLDDADMDDPDTAVVEALRNSDKPDDVFRARKMALQKLRVVEQRLRRRSDPPSR